MNKNTHNNDDYTCFDSIIIAKHKPSDVEPLEFHVGWHSRERLNHEFPVIELSRALEERGLWISR